MKNPYTITLSKHTSISTKNKRILCAGSSFFRFNITDEIINHLGRKVKINLRLNDANFPCIIIEKFGELEYSKPCIISGNTLRIPTKLIDEWSDLGDYSVDFGEECVILTKNNVNN